MRRLLDLSDFNLQMRAHRRASGSSIVQNNLALLLIQDLSCIYEILQVATAHTHTYLMLYPILLGQINLLRVADQFRALESHQIALDNHVQLRRCGCIKCASFCSLCMMFMASMHNLISDMNYMILLSHRHQGYSQETLLRGP